MTTRHKQPARIRKPFRTYWLAPFIPLLAVIAAFAIGAVMLLAMGVNPIEAYWIMLQGAFGSKNAIADTIVRATPLLFVAAGICVAFRGGVLNIGGEGQIVVGALSATTAALLLPNWPSWAIIPFCLSLGFLGGAVWGFIPGVLKAYLNVNEILTTIMMNQIAVQGMNFLLRNPLMDPIQIEQGSFIPQTARFSLATDLPRLVPTRLHAGALLAVVAAILVWILLWRTTVGFRIRAVGLSKPAARRAGIHVERYAMLALTISGALAGLAGATQVLGVNHRMFTDGSATGFTGSAGFNGIVVALFGQLHPLGAIPSSILFGAMITGANTMQRAMQVPTSLVVTLNGLLVIFVVASEIFRKKLNRQREMAELFDQNEATIGQAQTT